jgi:predicted O-methyltransferase YrrM
VSILLGPFRRIPAARTAARSARRIWEELRPLPRARYVDGTPNTGGATPIEVFFPPTISTLAEAALSREAAEFVICLLKKLEQSGETEGQELFYLWGQGRYGEHWRYADSTTALVAAAMAIRPKAYLEIGVRRGRSSAVIGALCPDCAIYGFDLWLPDYAGAPNPGPDFVRGELRKAGHTGAVTFTSGDSRTTVPSFLAQHPDLFFDVINVDGDHSVAGAARDLANVLPRLKVGGVIVFDDIVSAPALMRVWNWLVRQDARYRAWEFTDAPAGIAAAIRVGQ